MEGRSHARETYAAADEASRMQDDLDLFRQDLQKSFRARSSSREMVTGPLSVCVIGGGLAGLRCAEILIEKGVKVTLIEARGRLGGRVAQSLLGKYEVDLGPNWIHGTLDNPIVELANATGTVLCRGTEDILVFDHDGVAVRDEIVERCQEVMWSIIADAFRFSNQHCDSIPQNRSLKDFFIEQLPQRDLCEQDRALTLRMGEMWGSFIGDSWERQSLKNFWLEECLDGDNLFVATSHKAIISRVARAALEHADMKMKTRVTGIDSNHDSKVTIHTISGSHIFDEVVATIPLGCLKQSQVSFTPDLPPELHAAIASTTYSQLEKVFVSFPSAWWDGSEKDDEPLNGFAYFLHPEYAGSDNHWTLEVQSLSSPDLYGACACPTLLFTIWGPCAVHVTSLVAGQDSTSDIYLRTLDAFFRPHYSLLPNFSNALECKPRAILATAWRNDELAGNGAYTNFKISETPATNVSLEDSLVLLRRGLPERHVWLAGEHCAPFVALGTLTGAYWSGEAVGMRILAEYGTAGADA